MIELPVDRVNEHRRALVRSAVVLSVIAFGALLAVQLAGVSIVTPLSVDLIVVMAVAQSAVLLWCMQFRRCHLSVPQSVLAFAGLEIVLLLLVLVAVPEHVRADIGQLFHPDFVVEESHETIENRQNTANLEHTGAYDFPGFRGANRDGMIQGVELGRDWNRHPPKELWRRPVGLGWSSFAVVNGFCVTQGQQGEFETVVCYDMRTGEGCWEHRDQANLYAVEGGHGPRATPTISL